MPWENEDLRCPIISCHRVDPKLYRRSCGVGGPHSEPPSLEYILHITWEPVDIPLPQTSSRPWWHGLPSAYSIKRRWSDIEDFHLAFEHSMCRDPKTGMNRNKNRIPDLPMADDVDRWITLTASCGDAKVLRRQGSTKKGEFEVLDDLHERRVLQLDAYFEQISMVLAELPLMVLARSKKLYSLVFGAKPRDKRLPMRGVPALEKYFYQGFPQIACFDEETRTKFLNDSTALRALGAKGMLPAANRTGSSFLRSVSLPSIGRPSTRT
eukprot:gnl/MRDRNA2_/MRDRNA2_100253_c0_seq1.p1 gnl/MRDRNA2_/MRDRNA2_100253_c0~~gnl/MRDRNA2_/MRDRNA2_100253_c0_seq1.p1  ORF type:complete len:267 (+),score=26.55 gnl/MRDRNA2_/MRDRNA2_100253_c0_seq1:64-864(+)